QGAAQPGGAPLLLDLVEPGERGKTDASHLTTPVEAVPPLERCSGYRTRDADHRRGDLLDLLRRADVRRHDVDEVAERAQPDATLQRGRRRDPQVEIGR